MTLHSIRFVAHTLALGTLTLANAALAGEPAPGAATDTPPSRLMADDFDEPEVPGQPAPAPAAQPAANPQPAPAAQPAAAPALQPAPAASVAPAPVVTVVEHDEDGEPVRGKKRRGVREASTGFQGALRLGFMFPGGRATNASGDLLSSRYGWQLPLSVDIGFKPTPNVFVGMYMGLSLGAEGDDGQIEGYCDDDDDDWENDVACDSYTQRIGLEVQYHMLPDQRWNPWVGYGIGFIAANQSIEDRQNNRSESTTVSGMTYAQLSGGVDLRSALGVGPFAEVAIGRFNSTHTVIDDEDTFEGAIDDRAIHYWMTIGVRMVINP